MVQSTHRVLLLGSGMMTPPLVDYLTKFGDTHITVASNLIEDARKIASRHPNHMSAIYLDVFDVSIFANKNLFARMDNLLNCCFFTFKGCCS